MILELTRPLAFIDLETTGVDVEADRIVSLGIGIVPPGGADLIHVAERRFNPGRPIPPEATAVHGITDQDVADKPRFHESARVLHDALVGCDVAGFNVRSFDIPMLSAEFARAGFTWPARDVSVVDAYRVYNRKEPRTLSAAVRHYLGEEHEGAHDAKADVTAAYRVLKAQAERYGGRTVTELAALERDPSWLDDDGRLKWVGDVAVIGFGKWAGRPLSQVDPGYLQWMLRQDFPPQVKDIIAAALRGQYPTRAA